MSKNMTQRSLIMLDELIDVSFEEFDKKDKGFEDESEELTSLEGTMALLSTSIGAGFVAIPFGFYHLGIPFACFAIILIANVTNISVDLMLEA